MSAVFLHVLCMPSSLFVCGRRTRYRCPKLGTLVEFLLAQHMRSSYEQGEALRQLTQVMCWTSSKLARTISAAADKRSDMGRVPVLPVT